MSNNAAKRKRVLTFKCSFCGTQLDSNDTFVVTAEYKHFCIKINPGHPPIKDCMEDYRNKIKEDHVRNERLRQEAAIKEKQEQERLKRKKPTIELPIDSSFSQVSDIGDESGATSAHRLIIGNIRLETYNATSQAIAIYGDELKKFTTPDSPCALCGFPLKDRISYIHNRTHGYTDNPLTWSYDHFVPVNFSAVVFRIVTSKNYDIKELLLF